MRGTRWLEGIEVSEQALAAYAAEYENLMSQGVIDDLIQRARARFSSRGLEAAQKVSKNGG
ncbi:MAG: hypothetical protein C5B50_04955 [Verrucomicrobia bacterium]|nr:MAG: hypothetical protein C5B50_04955 [Verrucomicrobiota bacterium]